MEEKEIMKNLLRVIVLVIFLGVFAGAVFAKPFRNPLKQAINDSSISSSALISVSFKDVSNGKKAFEQNSKSPMSPASVQKLVTIFPSIAMLGESYQFKTQLYKNGTSSFYLKLGADPYLMSKDLKYLVETIKGKKIALIKSFYIDDSILDSNEWGEGWQWDNDLNVLMPRFGSYNLDKNLFTVRVCPTTAGAPAEISTTVFYPTAFVNNVITGKSNNIKFERKNYITPDVINADGTVASDIEIQVPVNYPRRYFVLRLADTLRKQNVSYYGNFNRLKLPKNVFILSEVKHSIKDAITDILKNSNNMIAETVFKLAGGKYSQESGSAEAAVDMLNEYYNGEGISTDNIKIVDGSGVSKNNLLTSDFITDVLVKESQKGSDVINYMAIPGEGTLKDRMLYLKDNLKAKTGTLTNVSAIAGYLKTRSGKTYAFCIMINDAKSKSADKKAFEEYILRTAFKNF